MGVQPLLGRFFTADDCVPGRDAVAVLTQTYWEKSFNADPAVIERRLQIFHADTGPLLNFYRERGILITIDAEQSMGAVSDAILTALRS